MNECIFYTGTILENIYQALDPNKRVYDKSKIKQSKFLNDGLYVGIDSDLNHIIENAIRMGKKYHNPVIIGGDILREFNNISSNPHGKGYILLDNKMFVKKIFGIKISELNYFQSESIKKFIRNQNNPIKNPYIKDITQKVIEECQNMST